jgi:hypothetical protein
VVAGEALGIIGVLPSLKKTPVVNREIHQILYDEIAALPATLLHIEQVPLSLKSRQRQLENGLCKLENS